MPPLRFFKESEFEQASPACKLSDMDPSFMQRLDDARALCSYAFNINSAYRSPEYERSRGRTGTSSHCKGKAVDLSCLTSRCRLQMLIALLAVGFRRIGIYPTFIHVDSDSDKSPSIWYGK